MTKSKGKRKFTPRKYKGKHLDTPEAKRLREYRSRWRASRLTNTPMKLYKRGRKERTVYQ